MNGRQLSFLDPPHNGRDTSKAAAEKVFRKTWYYREKIHAFLIQCGAKGATRFEIERALSPTLGLKNNSICPRVLELIQRGMVVEADEMRRTASGCNAHILIARIPDPTDR